MCKMHLIMVCYLLITEAHETNEAVTLIPYYLRLFAPMRELETLAAVPAYTPTAPNLCA